MTKSDVIRGLLRENPTGMPTALAKVASKKLGSPVKPGDISNYKAQMKRAAQLNGVAPAPEKPLAAPRPTAVTAAHRPMTVARTVEVVKELVQQLGKADLKKLVDVL